MHPTAIPLRFIASGEHGLLITIKSHQKIHNHCIYTYLNRVVNRPWFLYIYLCKAALIGHHLTWHDTHIMGLPKQVATFCWPELSSTCGERHKGHITSVSDPILHGVEDMTHK